MRAINLAQLCPCGAWAVERRAQLPVGQIELELPEIYCLSLNVKGWLLLLWDVKIQDADSWEEKLNSSPGVMVVRAISAEQLFLLWLAGQGPGKAFSSLVLQFVPASTSGH